MLRTPFVQVGAAWCNVRDGQLRAALGQVRGVCRETGMSSGRVAVDLLRSTLAADLRPSTYCSLRMWEMPRDQRRTLTPTVLLYRIHQLNDPALRPLLRDKVQFNREYAAWIGRAWMVMEGSAAEAAAELGRWLDRLEPSRIVLKQPRGQCGRGVRVVEVARGAAGWVADGAPLVGFAADALARGDVLVEEAVVPHPVLARLGSKSVGTLRILTRCRPDGTVEIGHAFLRMHLREFVDGADGWLSCRVDPVGGRLVGPARQDSGFDPVLEVSPGSGVRYDGFALPCWTECLELVRAAARLHPELVTVGWDVALTPGGPVLLEGNDNWSRCDVLAGPGQRGMYERWYAEIRAERSRSGSVSGRVAPGRA